MTTRITISLNGQQHLAIKCLAETQDIDVTQMVESIIEKATQGIRRSGRSEADFIRYCYGDGEWQARQAYHAKGGQ